MVAKVYHQNNTRFETDADNLKLADFTLVAEVAAQNLDEIYHLTNTVNRYWWKNAGVDAKVTKTRSTSVGDLIEINGVYHMVDRFGFKIVTLEA